MLRRCFGLHTYSKHEPAGAPMMERPLVDIIGAAQYDGDFAGFCDLARNSSDTCIVKTHDRPESDDPCIYVVRNGIAAADSYRHYRKATEKREVSWTEVLSDGMTWSDHLRAWDPLNRPNTLMVRFEDLTDRPRVAVDQLATFLAIEPSAPWQDPWRQAHELGPNFFRRGLSSISHTITDSEIEEFLRAHKTQMNQLGYYSASRTRRSLTTTAVSEAETA